MVWYCWQISLSLGVEVSSRTLVGWSLLDGDLLPISQGPCHGTVGTLASDLDSLSHPQPGHVYNFSAQTYAASFSVAVWLGGQSQALYTDVVIKFFL